MNNSLWLEGPTWLKYPSAKWPKSVLPVSEEIPEKRKNACFLLSESETCMLKRFSSYEKLLRISSYGLRFLKINKKFRGPISCDELENTEKHIIKYVQSLIYHKEISVLQKNKSLKKCRILSLNPFLDDQGILRVGVRLKNSKLSYNQRHPILLPSYHFLTDIIIRQHHLQNHHSGIQTTLYSIRRKFWILDGRNQVRKIIRNCVTCFRANPPNVDYKMGNLPSIRLKPDRPFLIVGVNYCGPFYIKEKKFRNRTKIKVYAAIFVCMVVKAVHIEIVGDMTTESFLAALKRFISRRGKPQKICSDNGTNFVGANNELKELYVLFNSEQHQSRVQNCMNELRIKWSFIPPLAPNFGGLWESTVKAFKHHYKRVARDTLFTFEEFNTLATEIEAILNSRPLTPISNDPNDFQSLTPGHFLINDSITSIPEPSLIDIPTNRLSVWQHITKIKQDFWNRWSMEYLNELNIRHKWADGNHNIKEGSLVILKEKNQPPMHWSLGRVVASYPGDDGIIRCVTVRTIDGEFKRSVKLLAPLPIDNN